MKMNLWAGMHAAVFVTLGVGLAGQTPAQDAAQNPSQASPDRIMVTGCVQPAATAPTGTSGTAGSASAESKFHLTNVAPTTAGAQEAGKASTSASPASTYRLDGEDAKLAPHVGHKVEISGTMAPASAGATASPSAASSAAKAPQLPQLKVDTVKMVASTCTG